MGVLGVRDIGGVRGWDYALDLGRLGKGFVIRFVFWGGWGDGNG